MDSFTQDVEPYLERAKALHNAGAFGDSEMRNMGTVPAVFVLEYIKRCGITMAEFMGNREHMKRFLEDPAISHFRVWKGRI